MTYIIASYKGFNKTFVIYNTETRKHVENKNNNIKLFKSREQAQNEADELNRAAR